MLKISAIMPVYNGEKYIKDTIDSVLGQTYKDFEFIIVDDGSTDNTLNIIKDFDDTRIRFITVNHGGIVNALNTGLDMAVSEYIVRVDGDDISLPERFERLLGYMENNKDVVVCGSWAKTINTNGEVTGELKYPPIDDVGIKKYLLLHNPFIHPSVIIRKDILNKSGKYKKYKHNEDYELWSSVLKYGNGHNIPEELILYRVHESQVTRKNNLRMRIVGVYVRMLIWFRFILSF
jgi:glycosyltransferase involved in cell wall biosynthesis